MHPLLYFLVEILGQKELVNLTCCVGTFIELNDSVEPYACSHNDENTEANDAEENDFLLQSHLEEHLYSC
jgi:hypothetical protein